VLRVACSNKFSQIAAVVTENRTQNQFLFHLGR
jgi:hypothetical protein